MGIYFSQCLLNSTMYLTWTNKYLCYPVNDSVKRPSSRILHHTQQGTINWSKLFLITSPRNKLYNMPLYRASQRSNYTESIYSYTHGGVNHMWICILLQFKSAGKFVFFGQYCVYDVRTKCK